MVGDLQRHCKGEGGSQHIAIFVVTKDLPKAELTLKTESELCMQ